MSTITIIKTIMVEGEGIALDALLYDLYRREDLVPLVLDVNPGLAGLGPVLPPGTQVRSPALPDVADTTLTTPVTLWG